MEIADLGLSLRKLHEEAANNAERFRVNFLVVDMFAQVYLKEDTAPSLDKIASYINLHKDKLKEEDILEFRQLWKRLVDHFPKNKSIEEVIEEVFPGGKWIDEKDSASLIPYNQRPLIQKDKRLSIYVGVAHQGLPQKWAWSIVCEQEGACESIKKTGFIGESDKDIANWIGLMEALKVIEENSFQSIDIYLSSKDVAKQVELVRLSKSNDLKTYEIAAEASILIKRLQRIRIHHDDILVKFADPLADFKLDKEIGKLRR